MSDKRPWNLPRALRLALLVGFVVPVLHQSYTEVKKYLSHLADTASWTKVDENVIYPNIVVCPTDSFRSGRLILTPEEYLNNTFELDEVIVRDSVEPKGKVTVQAIYTRLHGRCYVLKPDRDVRYTTFIQLQLVDPASTRVHVVDRGQELCVMLAYCDAKFDSSTVKSDYSVGYLSATMNIWRPGCAARYMKRKYLQLAAEGRCLMPYQILFLQYYGNYSHVKSCETEESYKDSFNYFQGLYENLMENGEEYGCDYECETWTYHYSILRFESYHARSVIPWMAPKSSYFKLTSPHIKVNQEYAVYDFSRVLGNVGGSLGMFVGFSFFDLVILFLTSSLAWLGSIFHCRS